MKSAELTAECKPLQKLVKEVLNDKVDKAV